MSFLVDGLTYAGLEWGDPEAQPVLALHGWLDNALSFSALAPLLNSTRLVALDLSGQGLSDHRSADATYHIWDDVPQLLGVVEQLGAAEIVVMGHSRGAAIAVLLASALAERCAGLILLDGMLPVPVAGSAAALQFRQAMSDRLSLQAHTKRRFQDVEDFVAARVKLGFSADSARARFSSISMAGCQHSGCSGFSQASGSISFNAMSQYLTCGAMFPSRSAFMLAATLRHAGGSARHGSMKTATA